MCSFFSLHQLVLQPTRANNVLDLLLTDLPSEDQNTLAVPGISDHSAVLCELNLRHVKVVNSGARRIYSYKKANTAIKQRHFTVTTMFLRRCEIRLIQKISG